MALSDAIASAKARVESLKASIQQQQTKKQDFAEFPAQQSFGLFDEKGKLLGSSSSPIQRWKDGAFVEIHLFVLNSNPPQIYGLKSVQLCDLAGLEDALVKRVMITPEEVIKRSLDPQSTAISRDGFAKTIYSRLFDLLVDKINNLIGQDTTSKFFIGVLDIYGFGSFKTNRAVASLKEFKFKKHTKVSIIIQMNGDDDQERTQETEDGKWAKVERIKKRMKKGKQRKFQGLSWIGKVSGFCFCRKNRMHCFTLLIRQQLQYLLGGTVGRASEAKDA
ncbi:uncharacterized protein DS421_15g504210 [Arachis hypogaea]|nr:uncharacterized protein DS421_15g504210 [Arachis hypogaea]